MPLKASHTSVRITCPVVPQLHMGDIPRHQSHLPLSQRNCVFSCALLTGFALPWAHQESDFSFRIQSTFSEVSLIKSEPVEGLSPTSIQQTGDLHGLPIQSLIGRHLYTRLITVVVGELCQGQVLILATLEVQDVCSQHVLQNLDSPF